MNAQDGSNIQRSILMQREWIIGHSVGTFRLLSTLFVRQRWLPRHRSSPCIVPDDRQWDRLHRRRVSTIDTPNANLNHVISSSHWNTWTRSMNYRKYRSLQSNESFQFWDILSLLEKIVLRSEFDTLSAYSEERQIGCLGRNYREELDKMKKRTISTTMRRLSSSETKPYCKSGWRASLTSCRSARPRDHFESILNIFRQNRG